MRNAAFPGRILRGTLFYLMLLAVILCTILPFAWMVSSSFKGSEAIRTIPIRWIPERPTLEGYERVFNMQGFSFARASLNSLVLAIACTAVAAIGMSPLQGDMNALIATCSEYTYLTSGKRVDGTMYSCTSLGTKLGGGIGTALAGWLLALSGYVGGAAQQSASCLNMLHVMYLWMPMCFNLLITLILTRLNVEKANEELRRRNA